MISRKNSRKISALRYLSILPFIIVLNFIFTSSSPQIKQNINAPSSENAILEPSFYFPLNKEQYKITSTFGKRMHPIKKKMMMHNGVDFGAKKGVAVMASANGIVIKKEFKENSYGNVIVIDHENGYFSLYSQLSEFKTTIGKSVKQGEIIGLVGSSGMSTGPHLHFEIKKGDTPVDPMTLLKD